ncbi:uncharacterized protein C10orf67, mitochondrial-like isoform X2 [Halichondria panicea]|uniref:uncharacterized protein C10orf67, mitochondrial-like isoform X2 n=1 Tax=Halichondria panicea TaxID=6063 RepID=UPI00312BA45B
MEASKMETNTRDYTRVSTASSLVPFERLPNLPNPVIPHIDLGIAHVDVDYLALVLAEEDSISSRKRVGFCLADNCTQTERSDIISLKETTAFINALVQDVVELRQDLTSAQHMLRADYESRLDERATQLHGYFSALCVQTERRHSDQVEVVRKSYRTQLNNAIQKIAGEYQAYYDELLQGKTGRTDSKIRELRQKIEVQVLQLEQSAETIADLTQKVVQYDEDLGKKKLEATPPALPPGISLEEEAELRADMERLEEDLTETMAELAASQDTTKTLTHQLNSATKQLEDERSKVNQLKKDSEAQKKKAKKEMEKAIRMAENQRASLEKEWREKAESAEKEAAHKAQEEAELQRVREQSKFQEELNRRQHLEDELRANQQRPPTPIDTGDTGNQVERLLKIEQKQKLEIKRLNVELDRTNKTWEMKLAVMQRNFHALRDEFYVRHSLQRQATSLHHAAVGYATS